MKKAKNILTIMVVLIILVGCNSNTVPTNMVTTQNDVEKNVEKPDELSSENSENNSVLDEYEKAVLELEALRDKNLKEAYGEAIKLEKKISG